MDFTDLLRSGPLDRGRTNPCQESHPDFGEFNMGRDGHYKEAKAVLYNGLIYNLRSFNRVALSWQSWTVNGIAPAMSREKLGMSRRLKKLDLNLSG